jgi:tetratricopeptide (TPR) repeat protein
MRRFAALLVVLSVAAGAKALAGASSAEWRWTLVHFARGDLAMHEKLLTQLIEETKVDDDNYVLLHLQRGLSRMHAGRLEGAHEDLWAAFKGSPQAADPSQVVDDRIDRPRDSRYKMDKREMCFLHFYLALNFLLRGSVESALVEVKQAAWIGEHGNALPEVDLLRSVIEFQLGQYDEAAVAARKCVSKVPGSAAGYLMLAKALAREPSLAQNDESEDGLLEKCAQRAGGRRPSISDRILLVAFVAFDRDDDSFTRSMTASSASLSIGGPGAGLAIPASGALIGTMRPGQIEGEKFRNAVKEAAGADGTFWKRIKRASSATEEDFDFWEDRYWAFLPRALGAVAVARQQVPTEIRLPVAEDWAYVSGAPPVLGESADLGYVALSPVGASPPPAAREGKP